ncbi:MAG TPA: hypothetical protein VGE74_21110 [Gemmata sp.]
MTAAQELALVDAAIETILTGGVSSYQINGRGATKLDLKQLWDRKRELEMSIDRASSTGGCRVAAFRRTD